MVELGVAMVWFDSDFVGCCGCRSLWLGFQENNSLGMFFVVVVLRVAVVWFDFDFVGCHGCQSWGLLLLLV